MRWVYDYVYLYLFSFQTVTDRIILLDDSGPTKKTPRHIKVLSDTLQQATSVATILEPSGIYVRFLKYSRDKDGGFDHMTDGTRIARKVGEVYKEENDEDAKLGTVLQEKVVQPLVIDKIDKGEFKKPVLVYIIMDGNVSLQTNSSITKYQQWGRFSH